MIIVQIAYEVPAATIAKIEAHLAEVALRDINRGGAEFEIQRDEFTCILNDNSIDAVALFYEINDIIRSEQVGSFAAGQAEHYGELSEP